MGPLHISLNSREHIFITFKPFFKKIYSHLFPGSKLAENPKPWRINLTLAKIHTILSLFFLYFTSYLIPIEKLFYFQPYHIAITYTNPILNISEHCFYATLLL